MKNRSWFKGFLILGLILVALLVGATLLITTRLGPIVKRVVETAAPRQLGVPVTVQRVDVRPWRGRVEVQGLVVANPEGFQSPSAFDLGELVMSIDLKSLFSDVIRVHEIRVRDPKLTYEMMGRRNNFGVIMERLRDRPEPAQPEAPDAPAPEEARPSPPAPRERAKPPAKRLIVDHFVFEGAQLSFSAGLRGVAPAAVTLPAIEMHGLGQPDGLPPEVIGRRIGEAIAARVLEQGQSLLPGADRIEQELRDAQPRIEREVDRGLQRLRGLIPGGE